MSGADRVLVARLRFAEFRLHVSGEGRYCRIVAVTGGRGAWPLVGLLDGCGRTREHVRVGSPRVVQAEPLLQEADGVHELLLTPRDPIHG